MQAFKKGKKNTPKKGSKSALNQSVATDPGEEEDLNLGRDELVDLANIEMVHKKRRHDKEARLKVSSLTQLFLYFFLIFVQISNGSTWEERRKLANLLSSTTYIEKYKQIIASLTIPLPLAVSGPLVHVHIRHM